MGVVHFLICGVLQHNILEKEVALKTTSADVTAVLRRNDSKKKVPLQTDETYCWNSHIFP